jgi:hypothetical protein
MKKIGVVKELESKIKAVKEIKAESKDEPEKKQKFDSPIEEDSSTDRDSTTLEKMTVVEERRTFRREERETTPQNRQVYATKAEEPKQSYGPSEQRTPVGDVSATSANAAERTTSPYPESPGVRRTTSDRLMSEPLGRTDTFSEEKKYESPESGSHVKRRKELY